MMMTAGPSIEQVRAHVYRFPADAPEADGTMTWEATTMVLVEIAAGGKTGTGYSYAARAAADVVVDLLTPRVVGHSAFSIPQLWDAMVGAVRNAGWRGIAACAIAAMDVALWDLKARLLEMPLASLFGQQRETVAIYGSGGFTSYSNDRLAQQLSDWIERGGCRFVKMKIGSQPDMDADRVSTARKAIGKAELFVDANGAYSRKQALSFAERFVEFGISWFEEPVSSDDLDGLRLIRDRGPAGMDIAAGEYGYDSFYFRRMLAAGAVDVIQADATRCCGYTGFLRAAALADAWGIPLSSHCAPALHLPVCCAAPRVRHMEWFHDHVRIEQAVFDGAPVAQDGAIAPMLDRPGHGLIFKRGDAEKLAAT
jgi:L-alanine-DL-glutamate epimerase-like enolase superfamily enzyme